MSQRMKRAPVGQRVSWRSVLVVLFVIAAGWRLLYLARLSESPLAESMFDDARIYWAWSERIVMGHLLGSNPFFLAPLYPYVLGLLRALGLNTPFSILAVQALWGAGAVILLADAARTLTTPVIGAVIGVLLCFYQMAVFFDGLFLTESLLFFLEALLLWWVVRTDWRVANWHAAGVAGVIIGLLAAGRATSALLLVPAVLLMVRFSARIANLAVLLAGFGLMAVPITVHNAVVAHELIPFTYNGGFNLYVGNNPNANGTFLPISGRNTKQPQGLDGGVELDGRDYLMRTEGSSFTPSGSSAYWSRKARSYIGANPGRFLLLVLSKLGMLWNAHEYPQIENVEEYRALAGPVGLPLVGTFALLGALALVGATFAWKSGPAGRFTLGYAVVLSLGTIPFFVTDRYRHQLVPACALLAAFGLQHLWLAWSRGSDRWRTFGALALGLVIVHLPTPGPTTEQRATQIAKNMGTRLLQSGFVAARSGHLDEAERAFAKAVQTDPRLYQAWGGLIRVQIQLGRTEDARITFERARLAGLPEPATHAYEGLFAALAHDAAAADVALKQIPQSSLVADPSLADVVAVTRRILAGTQ